MISFTKLNLILAHDHKYETLSDDPIHYLLVIICNTRLLANIKRRL